MLLLIFPFILILLFMAYYILHFYSIISFFYFCYYSITTETLKLVKNSSVFRLDTEIKAKINTFSLTVVFKYFFCDSCVHGMIDSSQCSMRSPYDRESCVAIIFSLFSLINQTNWASLRPITTTSGQGDYTVQCESYWMKTCHWAKYKLQDSLIYR